MADANGRDGRLVTAHDSRSGNVDHLRWYDIDTTGDVPVLIEEGEVNPGPSTFTYCGAIDIAANGDVGLTYDQSSTMEYLSMYAAGRSLVDPPGTLQDAVDGAPGQVAVTSLSAGFHADIGVDPNDGTTFWAVNTFQPRPGSWWTWVAAFYLDNGGGSPGIGVFGSRLPSDEVLGRSNPSATESRRPAVVLAPLEEPAFVADELSQTETTLGRPALAMHKDTWPLYSSGVPLSEYWEVESGMV